MSTNEWYTPPRYIQAVREVLGEIDLDPASCEFANRVVQARRFYTEKDNGLMLPWIAENVFCNPPYGKTLTGGASNLEYFTHKCLREYQCGNVKQAILLIPANTATSWFPPLWKYPICFPDFRIRFYTVNGPSDGASFGSIFIYMGANEQAFAKIFRQFGTIVKEFCPPKQELATALDLWSALTIDNHVAHESCRDAS